MRSEPEAEHGREKKRHQNFYMALRALIALTELAPALSALSAPTAHSSLLTQQYNSENMPGDIQRAYIGFITDLMDGER